MSPSSFRLLERPDVEQLACDLQELQRSNPSSFRSLESPNVEQHACNHQALRRGRSLLMLSWLEKPRQLVRGREQQLLLDHGIHSGSDKQEARERDASPAPQREWLWLWRQRRRLQRMPDADGSARDRGEGGSGKPSASETSVAGAARRGAGMEAKSPGVGTTAGSRAALVWVLCPVLLVVACWSVLTLILTH